MGLITTLYLIFLTQNYAYKVIILTQTEQVGLNKENA